MADYNICTDEKKSGQQAAFSVCLGFALKDREAESKVFTTSNTSFFINMDWAIVQRHIAYVTYKYETGDIFSSASDPALWLIDASNGNIVDDVFLDKKSYKLDGVTQFGTLGYNWILDLHSAFDFSAHFLHSEANDVDLDYQGLTVLASYFQRFDL